MKTFTDSIITIKNKPLYELFLGQLACMKDAEVQLTHALPLIAKVVKSRDLETLIQIHIKETQGHVKCVEQVAESLNEDLTAISCKAMKGLIHEAVKTGIKELTSACLDQAVIAAAQKIEHYEIASYGALCAWARQLGLVHEVALLTSTLGQEKIADALLTGLAEGKLPLDKLIEKVSLKKAGANIRNRQAF
jgi:ferritin-like metal-binding protein YciE